MSEQTPGGNQPANASGPRQVDPSFFTAVNEYLRRRRLERFRALRGKVDITSNEEIEAAELGELEQVG